MNGPVSHFPRPSLRLLRIIGWTGAGLILLLPLIAMRFTDQVNWTAFDFAFAAVLIGGTGLAFEIFVRMSDRFAYRAGAAIALGAAFLLIWASGAVGVIGPEDDPANRVFAGILAVALTGAILARLRPFGMAMAMAATAAVHAGVAVWAIGAGPQTLMINLVFTTLWLGSAALFFAASRQARRAPRGRPASRPARRRS